MIKENPYHILELEAGASEEDVKSAYRRLAMLWHPDKNQGDKLAEERFKKIAQAYSDITSGNVTSAAMPEFDFETGESFSDLFDRYFSKNYSRPKTYTVEIPITLDEAFTGVTKYVNIDGKRYSIDVPLGVINNYVLKVKLKIDGTNVSTVVATVKVLPHMFLKRMDSDIHTTAIIDLYTAILGGDAEMTLFGETLIMHIMPETQNGKLLRLKGKGMTLCNGNGARGDLYVSLKINIPVNLKEEEVLLFEQLRALRDK